MTLKLITIDLDETLLRKDKTYDTVKFDQIAETLNASGHKICIATGNSINKVSEYFDVDHHKELYYATENGNYIMHEGEILRTIGFSNKLLREILDFIDEFDGFYSNISMGDTAYLRKVDKAAFERIKAYNSNLELVDSVDSVPVDRDIPKIAILSEHSLEKNKRLVRIINERFEEVRAVTSGDGWVDVYSANGGKGSAVKFLQESLEITPQESIAFGDSLNDESMMREVYYSVAMQNADKDLKDVCRFEIGLNEDQAVLSLLEKYIDNSSLAFIEDYRIHNI